jgi:hypothetical protein
MPNSTASITIPLTVFNNLTTGNLCSIGKMTLSTQDTRVQLQDVTTTSNKIVVTLPKSPVNTADLDLIFSLDTSGLSGSDNYQIAYVLFGGPNSTAIFTGERGANSTSVTVTDALSTTNPTGFFEFFVIVQKGASSGQAGIYGIIDPPIENDQEA